jgi:hypothetical protein
MARSYLLIYACYRTDLWSICNSAYMYMMELNVNVNLWNHWFLFFFKLVIYMYAVDFTLEELKTLKLKQRYPFRDQQYNGMWMCTWEFSFVFIPVITTEDIVLSKINLWPCKCINLVYHQKRSIRKRRCISCVILPFSVHLPSFQLPVATK